MNQSQIKIGRPVEAIHQFPGVPKGTKGIIIQDYGTGIMIGWDKPERPYPKGKPPEVVAAMLAVNPQCPLRDGFDKKGELKYLKAL